MNLQPGNEDWCSPRTHKSQQQTEHNKINARKPYTWKSTHPFLWHAHMQSAGENTVRISAPQSFERKAQLLFCKSSGEFQVPRYAPHIFLPPPAIQSASNLYRLHMGSCMCLYVCVHIQAFTQHRYIFMHIYTHHTYTYIKWSWCFIQG